MDKRSWGYLLWFVGGSIVLTTVAALVWDGLRMSAERVTSDASVTLALIVGVGILGRGLALVAQAWAEEHAALIGDLADDDPTTDEECRNDHWTVDYVPSRWWSDDRKRHPPAA